MRGEFPGGQTARPLGRWRPWPKREVGCTLRSTNQPSPHVDKTRCGCLDPAAARLVRLPRGGATETMRWLLLMSWYSLRCWPERWYGIVWNHSISIVRAAAVAMHGPEAWYGIVWNHSISIVRAAALANGSDIALAGGHLRRVSRRRACSSESFALGFSMV